ncbi:hypothetical protein Cni_G07450 [Canna indica]|uniref:Transcription repressor n=1 Tax=Canna indica TaxID=4628 RepID=A0AAQ3Q5R3_9LILI|nr:hypothetical protein Cni_G07450 [Canna indica]
MERLKSSMKTLQEAIISMNPIGPICIQEARTQSFRSPADHHPYSPSDYQLLPHHFSMPSSSQSPERHDKTASSYDLFGAPLNSERFFFSPCTTKSIMEAARPEYPTTSSSSSLSSSSSSSSLCEESIMMAMSSEDPYHDFRASMEEMVAAHQLRDWHGLQELLHCYLRLNERENHRIIMLAFVDLLMHLLEQDKQIFSERGLAD